MPVILMICVIFWSTAQCPRWIYQLDSIPFIHTDFQLTEIQKELKIDSEINILDIFKALSSNKQIEYFSASVSAEEAVSPGLIKKLSNILSTNYNLQTCRLRVGWDAEVKFKKIMKRNKAAQIRHRFKKTKLAAQWVNKMNHFQLLNKFDLYLTK